MYFGRSNSHLIVEMGYDMASLVLEYHYFRNFYKDCYL